MSPQFLRESLVGPLDTTFSAVSTYASDFKKLGPGRQRIMRPRGDGRTNEPFTGTSEYRREYHELQLEDRTEIIHLATETLAGQATAELREADEEAGRAGELLEFEVPAE